MFVAVDDKDERVYASSCETYQNCFCPVCGERLRHKNKGKIRRPHFAHIEETNCELRKNKDYNNEWHTRMEELFPIETREYRFVDSKTKEKHIADIYIKDANTVIEFQHSRIDEEEFISRTAFHLNNGRRIVWVFDESPRTKSARLIKRHYSETAMTTPNGILHGPYYDRTYIWLRNPRRVLAKVPEEYLHSKRYSVCVYTGEDNTLHRIIKESDGFHQVIFSLHEIKLSETIDIEEFFRFESFWREQEPWKSEFQWRKKEYEKLIFPMEEKLKKLEEKLKESNITPWF